MISPAGFERGVRKRAHQPDIAAAVDDSDFVRGEVARQ